MDLDEWIRVDMKVFIKKHETTKEEKAQPRFEDTGAAALNIDYEGKVRSALKINRFKAAQEIFNKVKKRFSEIPLDHQQERKQYYRIIQHCYKLIYDYVADKHKVSRIVTDMQYSQDVFDSTVAPQKLNVVDDQAPVPTVEEAMFLPQRTVRQVAMPTMPQAPEGMAMPVPDGSDSIGMGIAAQALGMATKNLASVTRSLQSATQNLNTGQVPTAPPPMPPPQMVQKPLPPIPKVEQNLQPEWGKPARDLNIETKQKHAYQPVSKPVHHPKWEPPDPDKPVQRKLNTDGPKVHKLDLKKHKIKINPEKVEKKNVEKKEIKPESSETNSLFKKDAPDLNLASKIHEEHNHHEQKEHPHHEKSKHITPKDALNSLREETHQEKKIKAPSRKHKKLRKGPKPLNWKPLEVASEPKESLGWEPPELKELATKKKSTSKLNYEVARALVLEANAFMGQNKINEAQKKVIQAKLELEHAPNPALSKQLSVIEQQLGMNLSKQHSQPKDTEIFSSLYLRGIHAMAAGDYKKAQDLFKKRVLQTPHDVAAQIRLAECMEALHG